MTTDTGTDAREYLSAVCPEYRQWLERLPSNTLRWHHLYFWQRADVDDLADLPPIPLSRVINDVYLMEPGRRYAHGVLPLGCTQGLRPPIIP